MAKQSERSYGIPFTGNQKKKIATYEDSWHPDPDRVTLMEIRWDKDRYGLPSLVLSPMRQNESARRCNPEISKGTSEL